MSQLDKTKKSIGVDAIDEKLKKEMFKKFQDAGGQVIQEKEGGKTVVQSKSKQPLSREKSSSKKDPKTNPKTKATEEGNDKDNSINKTKNSSSIEAEMGSFFNKILIKFKCWANNVTAFNNNALLPQFMSELNLEFRQAIIELKIANNDLLSNPEISPKLTKTLDKINPIYVELIARSGKIFDNSEINNLFESYNNNPSLPVNLNNAYPFIYSLFKKLYYLYPYQATYKKAITAAYENMQKLEGKPAVIYTTKKKKILNESSLIFDKYFEKLYLVILRKENKNIPLNSIFMENLLEINDEDRPGKRKIGEDLPPNIEDKPKEEVVEEKVEETKEKEPEVIVEAEEIQLGRKLMFDLSLESLRKKHDQKNEYSDIPDSDKCYLSYMYFKEFDYEYSVVMTTKKINIQTINVNGNKFDHRQNLLGIYETSRNSVDQFKQYLESFREYLKVKNNPGNNYIEHSKKLTSLEQKRSVQSRNCRTTIKEFAEKTTAALKILIDDINGDNAIVANANETLSFDSVEARKKLNKKEIKQCILESYSYIMTLLNRLEEGIGDLYGGIVELTPEQMHRIYGKNIPKPIEAEEQDSNLSEITE
jgi:hypothetical protein